MWVNHNGMVMDGIFIVRTSNYMAKTASLESRMASGFEGA